MVRSCYAPNCKQRTSKGISFFTFPKDPELLIKWTTAMGCPEYVPSKNAKLCYKHFSKECFGNNGGTTLARLKNDAVPSIFPQEESKNGKTKKLPANYNVDEIIVIPKGDVSFSPSLQTSNKKAAQCLNEELEPSLLGFTEFLNAEDESKMVPSNSRNVSEDTSTPEIDMASLVRTVRTKIGRNKEITTPSIIGDGYSESGKHKDLERSHAHHNVEENILMNQSNSTLCRAEIDTTHCRTGIDTAHYRTDVDKTGPVALSEQASNTRSSGTFVTRCKRTCYIGDFTEKDMESPKKAKMFYFVANRKWRESQAIIKSLRYKNRRLLNAINDLRTLAGQL